eukprot:scaffold111419_cov21-Prasinocladus_malaysianus.AAC.1
MKMQLQVKPCTSDISGSDNDKEVSVEVLAALTLKDVWQEAMSASHCHMRLSAFSEHSGIGMAGTC